MELEMPVAVTETEHALWYHYSAIALKLLADRSETQCNESERDWTGFLLPIGQFGRWWREKWPTHLTTNQSIIPEVGNFWLMNCYWKGTSEWPFGLQGSFRAVSVRWCWFLTVKAGRESDILHRLNNPKIIHLKKKLSFLWQQFH